MVSSSVARERVDQLVGQLADEADGVGEEVGAALEAQRARRRVERVEQPVAHADVGARQRVEQRRLARVRVAGERDRRQVRALALGALRRARGAHAVELAAQRGDPVARQPAVGLDLRLARAAGADAADAATGAQTLEMRPEPAHAGHVVLELGELDLQLAVGRARVDGEDVEDHGGAVDHRHPELLLEVALLARGELVVAGDEVRVRLLDQQLELLDLARPEVEVRVRLVALLDQLADDGDAGRAQQLLELREVALGQRSDDVGALLRAARPGRRRVARLRCAAGAGLLHCLECRCDPGAIVRPVPDLAERLAARTLELIDIAVGVARRGAARRARRGRAARRRRGGARPRRHAACSPGRPTRRCCSPATSTRCRRRTTGPGRIDGGRVHGLGAQRHEGRAGGDDRARARAARRSAACSSAARSCRRRSPRSRRCSRASRSTPSWS